jgi:hypothetical protein
MERTPFHVMLSAQNERFAFIRGRNYTHTTIFSLNIQHSNGMLKWIIIQNNVKADKGVNCSVIRR